MLLRSYNEITPKKFKTVSCPVNIRPLINTLVIGDFGLFVKSVEVSVDCSLKRPFWDVARNLKRNLEAKIHEPFFMEDLTIINNIPPKLDTTVANMLLNRNKLSYDVSVTNLGVTKLLKNYGAIEIESLYGPCVNGFELEQVLGVATINNQMSLSFVYRNSMMSKQSAIKIKDSINRQLLSI
jgi:hypothetical protein